MNLPGGTVTFLFTDIENSSSLWESFPEQMSAALTRHNTLVRQEIERNGGTVFKMVGDAFCAAFASPPAALQAAVAAQRSLLAEPWEACGVPIKVRMGLHVGTPECRDSDYFGPSVNRVARVCDLGHGGQILLSRAVQEVLGDAPPVGVKLRSLQAWRLKGMARSETIFQAEAPGLPTDFPPLRSVSESTGNLPEILSSFVGREQEIGRIARHLDNRKLLTLRGAGGCGKTRLAIEASRPLPVDYPGGVWLIRLDSLHNPDLIAREVARTLHVYVSNAQTTEQALTLRLNERASLLLLDNCEHLRTACARFVHDLLAHCRDLRVLATSREPLGIPGEFVMEVSPLRLPRGGEQPSLQALRASEAVQLFTARAEAGGGFVLNRDNAPAVTEICRALDGIPLALELAARWVGILPIEEIARELRELINEPTDDLDLIPARQHTMLATVDWSFHRLEPDAQKLFLNLAVFVGGFTLEAARAINTDAETSTTRALLLLKGLVEKSFVFFDQNALPDPRYRLLEPVREVATAKLLQTGEENVVRDRHHDWFLSYAVRADPELQGTQQALWLDRLESDRDNFRAALKWSVNPKTRLRLAMALHRFWLVRGPITEARAWVEGALAQATDITESERARTINVLGILAWKQGEIETAKRCFEESLAIWRRLDVLPETAMVLNNMAMVAKYEGQFLQATRFYQQCLTIYRDLKDDRRICTVLNNLGGALSEAGDHSAALPLLEESLRLHQDRADTVGESTTLYNLGDTAFFCNRFDDAEKHFIDGLRLFSQLGEEKSIVRALVALAAVYCETKRFVEAVKLLSIAQISGERAATALSPTTQARFEKTVSTLRQAISQEQFDHAWQEGQTANTMEVVVGLCATSLPHP